MSRQDENPAKSAASHLMRRRIVRWLCESCAGSSGDLLTPSPPAENGIAAHPRRRGDRMRLAQRDRRLGPVTLGVGSQPPPGRPGMDCPMLPPKPPKPPPPRPPKPPPPPPAA